MGNQEYIKLYIKTKYADGHNLNFMDDSIGNDSSTAYNLKRHHPKIVTICKENSSEFKGVT